MAAAKPKAGIALVFGAPKKAPTPMGPDPDGDSDSEDEDYSDMAKMAFPDQEWTPDRLAALKELVKSCM